MKTKSLNDRARMHPVNIYGEMVREVPLDLLEQPASFNYFGSSTHMLLTQTRRKLNNMTHDSSNTIAVENDQYFVNDAKADMYDVDVDLSVRGYQEHIEKGNNRNVKWRLNNYPYNWPGQGASRLWAELVLADNLHGILDFQGDILPTSLQRGQDSQLIDMRNRFLNDYGLYKVGVLPPDAFSEWNADVDTAQYYCLKGYNEDITVKTDISTYKYDFRSKGLIVTPDTLDEVDFIFDCYSKDSYDFKMVKHIVEGKSLKNFKKDPNLYSETKTTTHKYPIVVGLKANENIIGYTSAIIDSDYDKDRIAIPYQVGGYDGGKRQIGVVKKVEAGIQIGNYLTDSSIVDNINVHAEYLKSLLSLYLLYTWRTGKTNDYPQLRVIPKLHDTSVETDDDILELFGATDLKEEIINGLGRKIKKK